MADAILGKASYRRANGNFPEVKLINMFLEASPVSDEGSALLSFPGLESVATRGTGPINGMFQKAGLFSGAVFSISNNTLYKDGTSLGTVAGSGPTSWAASGTELVVTRGGSAYSYNGTNLAAIAFPDSANVTAVAGVIGGLFLYARASSGRYYWSAVLDGRTVDALDYATAESAPDNLRDIIVAGDNAYLMGEDTIEVWYVTGDLNLPFSRISQKTTQVGVIATGCAVVMDNAVHFVGSDQIVYRMGEVPERISDSSMEERIDQSTTYECFTFGWQGHKFFVVRLSQGTWFSDPSMQYTWGEKQTWGMDNWVARCAVTISTGPQFGSSVGDDILEFSGWEEGASPLLRQFTAYFPIKGGCIPVDILEVEANPGEADPGITPIIEMRSSRDGGDTFTDWRPRTMGHGGAGLTGQYRKRPRWRRCGYFDAPGGLFEFRCTDAAPLRVSAVRMNESAAGRSR